MANCHQMLRPVGVLLFLEISLNEVAWAGFTFGLLEGRWLFEKTSKHDPAIMDGHVSEPRFGGWPNPIGTHSPKLPSLPDASNRDSKSSRHTSPSTHKYFTHPMA